MTQKTFGEILASMPDDTLIPVLVVRAWLAELEERHQEQLEFAVEWTMLLRDFAQARPAADESLN